MLVDGGGGMITGQKRRGKQHLVFNFFKFHNTP